MADNPTAFELIAKVSPLLTFAGATMGAVVGSFLTWLSTRSHRRDDRLATAWADYAGAGEKMIAAADLYWRDKLRRAGLPLDDDWSAGLARRLTECSADMRSAEVRLLILERDEKRRKWVQELGERFTDPKATQTMEVLTATLKGARAELKRIIFDLPKLW